MNTKKPEAWMDFHTHCLPGMDDGARDVETAVQMLRALQEQGVRKVALTPHYYPPKESLSHFLDRRQEAWEILCAHPAFSTLPELVLGAEVYVTQGMSTADLRPLCMGKTSLLLLELPRQGYKAWLLEEIQNLTYALHVIPLLAHIERYLVWYSQKDYEELLAFEDIVLQGNTDAFLARKTFHFLYALAKKGCPLLMGSDAHNMTTRSPNFTQSLLLLQKSRKGQFLLAGLQNEQEKYLLEE